MEQRNVFLQGIAAALNAVGSTLVGVYDLTASTLGNVLPGEKEKPNGKIREYEQKIERLYSDVGKEVTKDREITRLSAAGEAALSLIAEYRNEIEKIKQGMQPVAEAEKQKKEEAPQVKEPPPWEKREEPAVPVIVSLNLSQGPEVEAEKEAPAEPMLEALSPDTREAGGPITDEGTFEVEMGTEKEIPTESAESNQEKPAPYTMEMLGNKLKGDLLALSAEKGIGADKSMTKAEIIELLIRQS